MPEQINTPKIHFSEVSRDPWCRMLCAYSIGDPMGAGQISWEKHYHPFGSSVNRLWGYLSLLIKDVLGQTEYLVASVCLQIALKIFICTTFPFPCISVMMSTITVTTQSYISMGYSAQLCIKWSMNAMWIQTSCLANIWWVITNTLVNCIIL